MHAESFMRRTRLLTIIIPVLALAGCGEGDGQAKILGTAATPLPDAPAGFCDSINFELPCPPLASITEFEGGPISIIDNPQIDANNDSARVGQMQKFAAESGLTFGGSTMGLGTAINVTAGSSFTMNVWSPRSVKVLFQPEPAGPGSGVEVTHGGTGWELLTFDFGSFAGTVSGITLIFDNGILGNANADPGNWTFYFDDITLVPPGGGGGGGGGTVSGTLPDVTLYDPAGNPDLVIPDDYSEITPFGSESVINEFFADDDTYSPVLAVSSGTGYGANIGQVGYIGFAAGFASGYESLDFKVKGMPNFVIIVKLFDGVDTLRINLTSSSFSGALGDGWYQVSIPLSRFSGVAQATGVVFESDDSASMQFTFLLSDIGFSNPATGGGGGGGSSGDELIVNGDFETGDLTGWTTFANGGSITVTSPGSGSNFAANVDASGGPRNPTLKQSNLGAGQLTPGQAVTVTFDWKGTAAVGGVVDLVLFSETSTGGPSQTDQILSGDAFPADWTTVGPLTINIGPDVSGGLTFQFTAICGGDTICESNLLLDNVSITAVGTGGGGTGGGGTGGGGTGGGGTGGGGTGSGGDIAINGGFESGDFSGWETFPNGGTQVITSVNPSSGTFAANLTVPVRSQTDPAVDNLIKNANLQAGNLTPGASVTVSFDMRGSLSGAGGVVFAEFFSELTGGGTSKAEIFTGGPLTPVDAWTPYSFNTTLGPDVSGGVTLQLKTSCGPVEGCGVDAFFDNVAITIN